MMQMRLFSIWNFGLAVAIITAEIVGAIETRQLRAGGVYPLGVALIHAIYGIWFLKGKDSADFSFASGFSRVLVGLVFAVYAVFGIYNSNGLLTNWRIAGLAYLVANAVIYLTTGMLGVALHKRPNAPAVPREKMQLEHYNRFAFAVYMVILALWVLSRPLSFTTFFHLPGIVTASPASVSANVTLQVFAILLFQLAIFNFIAVKYRLKVLIEAGMRGGLATCAFVLILVVFSVVHPLVLLLPAVDLVSVLLIFINKIIKHRHA
jgi:hypothetical protein